MAKNVENESDDLVPVEEGSKLTKMLDKLGVTQTREDEKEFLMAKEDHFAHGGEEGLAKSTRLRSCAFLLVVNAGKLGPRDRSQAQLTGATWSDNNTE